MFWALGTLALWQLGAAVTVLGTWCHSCRLTMFACTLSLFVSPLPSRTIRSMPWLDSGSFVTAVPQSRFSQCNLGPGIRSLPTNSGTHLLISQPNMVLVTVSCLGSLTPLFSSHLVLLKSGGWHWDYYFLLAPVPAPPPWLGQATDMGSNLDHNLLTANCVLLCTWWYGWSLVLLRPD